MSTAFRPIAVQQFAKLAHHETPEDRFWAQFQAPQMVKELGPVLSINFSERGPFDYAVTAGSHVHVYSGRYHTSKFKFSRFTSARSGVMRNDGKLLVAGDKSGEVKVFNLNTKTSLRSFEGHRKDVRTTGFLPDGSRVFSAGEEGVVKVWDIAQEEEAASLNVTSDYIQSARSIKSNPSLLFAGSYDHKAYLLDVRTSSAQLSVDHGASIESVWVFDSGATVVTAGHHSIRIWDVLAGGKLVETLSNHRQTITDICLDRQQTRLFSCGLDRMVKVYDVSSWNVIQSMKFSGQLLSVAMSPDNSAIAVGHSDGFLGVRISQNRGKDPSRDKPSRQPRVGTHRYFMRGQNKKPTTFDYQVNVPRRRKLKQYDKLLKSFQYKEALDHLFIAQTTIVVKASFFRELILREALRHALSDRDDLTLEPILNFVVQNITNPRYTRLLIYVAHVILDIYSPGIGMSRNIDTLFAHLASKLKEELALQRDLSHIMGTIDSLLVASQSFQNVTPNH